MAARDHSPVDLELTPTPVNLPTIIPRVATTNRSFVFTASPRHAPMNFLRSETQRRGSSNGKRRRRLPSELIETFDWDSSPLGSRDKWPTALKLMVRYMMGKPIASSIMWGWPDLVILYNDTYARMIGPKHPGIYGQPAKLAWGEIWDSIGPAADMLDPERPYARRTMFFNSLTELQLPEEVYHSWHWTPIWQDDGSIDGIWNTTWETTTKVIAERRLSCMSELFSRLADTRTQEKFGEGTLEVLARNPCDLPFIALYWCRAENPPSPDDKTKAASLALKYLRHQTSSLIQVKLTLAGSIGIPSNHPMARETIEYTLDPVTYHIVRERSDSASTVSSPLPTGSTGPTSRPKTLSPPNSSTSSVRSVAGLDMTNSLVSGSIEIVDPLPSHLARPRRTRIRRYPTDSSHTAHLGFFLDSLPHAILVVGLNTRRTPLDQLLASRGLDGSAQYKLQLAARNFHHGHEQTRSRTPCWKIQTCATGALDSRHRSSLRSLAEKKGIEFKIEIAELEVEPVVYVDPGEYQFVGKDRVQFVCREPHGRVRMTLLILGGVGGGGWNRLSNAFKYTTRGVVTVSVVHELNESHVQVRDTGVGIPKDYLNQVFDRFFRVHNNTAEGTGVGLSLIKELVSLHGGQILLESQTEEENGDNSGSAFTVVLPRGSSHLPTSLIQEMSSSSDVHGTLHKEMDYWTEFEQPVPSSAGSASDEGESATSPSLAYGAGSTRKLEERGHAAICTQDIQPLRNYLEAQDGLEALQIAKSQKLHIILCDVMMPRMDGPTLVKHLREERKTRFLPVIFVTASDDGAYSSQIHNTPWPIPDNRVQKVCSAGKKKAQWIVSLQLGKRRLKLEDEFEARSYELQVLGELSPVGIFRTDAEGRLTYLNPAWYQITGYPAGRERDEWLDHIAPESKDAALRVWKGCFENRESAATRLLWKNDVWTHAVIAPLINADGSFAGSFGAVMDINEQYRLEEARIALAEEREHIAASRAEDADTQRQLEHNAKGALNRQPVSAIIQNAEVVRTNMKGLRDILHDCRKRGLSYTPTDRLLEELEDDLQAMDSIMHVAWRKVMALSRIANDVLSLSRIQLNMLTVVPTDFDVKHETNQILLVFRNELIAKNIDFKLNFGHGVEIFGLRTVKADRSRFAQTITNLMSNAIRFTDMSSGLREIKVSLELSLDPPKDESCAVPPFPSGQALRSRSPITGTGVPDIYIYVSVQDSGPGLQKEDLALLFQRFQQGSNAHHVFGGSGLGLFVSWEEGSRLLASQVKARFRFFIRAAAPEYHPPPPPPGRGLRRSSSKTSYKSGGSTKSASRPLPETPNIHRNRPLHILITEDNKINQNVLARQMKRAGFTVVLASNGLEAIQAIDKADLQSNSEIRAETFDVVLMDLEMPVLDGFAATREIRRRESLGTLRKRNFIIALTGNARLEQVQAAQEAGVDDVMIKPYQIDALISKMKGGHQPASR
ncbi:response regulator receiver [Rhizoctonia solani]|uniref:histidine kinase n=1 Tax=Rhizoctonia solani TaxID=456999 RepID=A0A8H8NP25_9AGAM|nr:response regulator receiver [Rhizoctonia solani]QRW17341.1 response regulator receiver [Rhizoctonia solani]